MYYFAKIWMLFFLFPDRLFWGFIIPRSYMSDQKFGLRFDTNMISNYFILICLFFREFFLSFNYYLLNCIIALDIFLITRKGFGYTDWRICCNFAELFLLQKTFTSRLGQNIKKTYISRKQKRKPVIKQLDKSVTLKMIFGGIFKC